MKPNEKQILQLLSNTPNLVSIAELSKKTGYTERYIRNIIKDIHENEGGHGYTITYVFRKGIRLTIHDPFIFNVYMNEEEQSISSAIILYLLEKRVPVPASDLQERFFLSKTTLENYMKKVRSILFDYNLILTTEGHQGYIIFGKELNKRTCFSRNLKFTQNDVKHLNEIRYVILDILGKHNYEISDDNIYNLSHHIMITLRRIFYKEYTNEPLKLKEEYPLQTLMAREIIDELSKRYSVEIPDTETSYLVLHLLTKQSVQDNDEITPEIRKLAKQILEAIKEKNHVDLTKQFDMQFNLCLHLQPMLIRVEYGVVQENPLTDDIKRELPDAYELALTAKQVIQEQKLIDVNDAETGYLALHFALGLDKMKEKKTFKVLVACTSGKGTSRLLAHQLMEEYNLPEESVTISSVYKLHELNLTEYNCLLSTVPLYEEVPIPYMVLPVSVNSTKAENVRSFMFHQMNEANARFTVTENNLCEIDAKFKEDVFRFIVDRLPNKMDKEEMYQSLVDREVLSSTEVGNHCAMPHPLKADVDQSYLYIIRLKKPIIWDNQKVQLVIFSIWAENEDATLSQKIIDLVSNQGAVSELLDDFTLNTFTRLVRKS